MSDEIVAQSTYRQLYSLADDISGRASRRSNYGYHLQDPWHGKWSLTYNVHLSVSRMSDTHVMNHETRQFNDTNLAASLLDFEHLLFCHPDSKDVSSGRSNSARDGSPRPSKPQPGKCKRPAPDSRYSFSETTIPLPRTDAFLTRIAWKDMVIGAWGTPHQGFVHSGEVSEATDIPLGFFS